MTPPSPAGDPRRAALSLLLEEIDASGLGEFHINMEKSASVNPLAPHQVDRVADSTSGIPSGLLVLIEDDEAGEEGAINYSGAAGELLANILEKGLKLDRNDVLVKLISTSTVEAHEEHQAKFTICLGEPPQYLRDCLKGHPERGSIHSFNQETSWMFTHSLASLLHNPASKAEAWKHLQVAMKHPNLEFPK